MRALKIPKRFFQVDNFQNEGGTTDEIRNDFFFEKKSRTEKLPRKLLSVARDQEQSV